MTEQIWLNFMCRLSLFVTVRGTNLVQIVQFQKREKHPERSVSLNKVADLSQFFKFLNCTDGIKSRKASHW